VIFHHSPWIKASVRAKKLSSDGLIGCVDIVFFFLKRVAKYGEGIPISIADILIFFRGSLCCLVPKVCKLFSQKQHSNRENSSRKTSTRSAREAERKVRERKVSSKKNINLLTCVSSEPVYFWKKNHAVDSRSSKTLRSQYSFKVGRVDSPSLELYSLDLYRREVCNRI
jgi:hypothetical protein